MDHVMALLFDKEFLITAFVGIMAFATVVTIGVPYLERGGLDALPIVSLISFLMGLITAFQAAVQLTQFGADIYVANLVGLSIVREYVQAHGDSKPLRIYYFRGQKSHGYYDADGRAVHEGGWRKPIKGAPITSRFNPLRKRGAQRFERIVGFGR